MLHGNPSKKSAAELAAAGAPPAPEIVAPECPAFLNEYAKEEWHRIVDDLVTLGVVTELDTAELAAYCIAWADFKRAREQIEMRGAADGMIDIALSGYKQMSVWLQIANNAEARMRSAGNSFGLNPAARSRLNVKSPQGELFPNDQKEKGAKYF
jgi:P27 family predicted phage terminase small subunit